MRTKYRGVEQLEARRAHNPEVVGSSPASATIRKDLLSQDSESFFAYLEHSDIVVIFRVQSVSVCSVWAANRAARAKIGSQSRSTRRRPADESPLKFPIPQCTSHTGSSVRGYFCGRNAKTYVGVIGMCYENSPLPLNFVEP